MQHSVARAQGAEMKAEFPSHSRMINLESSMSLIILIIDSRLQNCVPDCSLRKPMTFVPGKHGTTPIAE